MAKLTFNNVYLNDCYTIVGPKEKDSKINNYDLAINDFYYEAKTFELAEIKMQRVAIESLINRNKLADRDIDYLIGGDLINQISISSYSAKNFKIPYLGVYSACATFIEELILASNFIESKNANKIICITSSHNLTAERQFRYPTEYGNTKPHTATCTVTGAAAAMITNTPSNVRIKRGTIGKIIDLGVNDVNHMGAVMAPACADTLYEHLKTNNLKISDFDLILTGDLGCVGLDILKEYYENVYHEKLTNIMDSGCEIYLDHQNMYSGGSGPSCLPLVLFGKILKNKKYKKILLLGTGSLHTTVLVNQHESIPAISHAIELEVVS